MKLPQTVAELKRLPIGSRLRLVYCLLGTTDKARVLARVESRNLLFTGDGIPAGRFSYLPIPRASEFRPTSDGFEVMEGAEVAARYVLEKDGAA
jgi:hypothetical protein